MVAENRTRNGAQATGVRRTQSQLEQLVQNAECELRQILGSGRDFIVSKWEADRDAQGRDLLKLTLSDPASDVPAKVEARFSPEEIDNDWHFRGRLYSLWGDLLQMESQGLLRNLRERHPQAVKRTAGQRDQIAFREGAVDFGHLLVPTM